MQLVSLEQFKPLIRTQFYHIIHWHKWQLICFFFRIVAPAKYSGESEGCTRINGDTDQVDETVSEPCPGFDECPTDQAKGWLHLFSPHCILRLFICSFQHKVEQHLDVLFIRYLFFQIVNTVKNNLQNLWRRQLKFSTFKKLSFRLF